MTGGGCWNVFDSLAGSVESTAECTIALTKYLPEEVVLPQYARHAWIRDLLHLKRTAK